METAEEDDAVDAGYIGGDDPDEGSGFIRLFGDDSPHFVDFKVVGNFEDIAFLDVEVDIYGEEWCFFCWGLKCLYASASRSAFSTSSGANARNWLGLAEGDRRLLLLRTTCCIRNRTPAKITVEATT